MSCSKHNILNHTKNKEANAASCKTFSHTHNWADLATMGELPCPDGLERHSAPNFQTKQDIPGLLSFLI